MSKQLQRKPFLEPEVLEKHIDTLLEIEKSINDKLKDWPNFIGIDFCAISDKHINIRGFHKDIKDYSYGEQVALKNDFSNQEECIADFVESWIKYDTPAAVKSEQIFIADGEKWGWN